MNQPIYIVDDDEDDNEFIASIWSDLGYSNELKFFTSGKQLIDLVKSDTQVPFIIICDVNLPIMNGFEIKEQLLSDPATRYKTIPFIFWSNSASTAQIKKAYDLS